MWNLWFLRGHPLGLSLTPNSQNWFWAHAPLGHPAPPSSPSGAPASPLSSTGSRPCWSQAVPRHPSTRGCGFKAKLSRASYGPQRPPRAKIRKKEHGRKKQGRLEKRSGKETTSPSNAHRRNIVPGSGGLPRAALGAGRFSATLLCAKLPWSRGPTGGKHPRLLFPLSASHASKSLSSC